MNRHGVGVAAVVDAAIEGIAHDESGTDIGCSKVRTGTARCRERQPRGEVRTIAGPARFSSRTA